MRDEDKALLIERIREKIARLREDIARLEESSRPVEPDQGLGRITRMEAISSQGVNDAALRSSRDRLGKLLGTAERINQPDFGVCNACKRPIPVERMEALPETRLCVPCLEKATAARNRRR